MSHDFLSKRVKRKSQSGITSDRYEFLSLDQAEPDLGDPTVGPSAASVNSFDGNINSLYFLGSDSTGTGKRYWLDQSAIVAASSVEGISVRENSVLVGSAGSIKILDFTGDVGVAATVNSGVATITFSAGVINYANVAGLATALQNSRTFEITGDIVASPISFNGTGNVSLAATIQPNSVGLGTDTTGNYVTSITNGSYITGADGGSEGAALTLSVDATSTNTASKVVARDASGNFSASTITANLTGTASYATNAGIATYASTAGIATYTSNAGIATYAQTAGIATYATNAGIATYATNAGIATNIEGGNSGDIPYQTSQNTTSFINASTATVGQVVLWDGNAPYWGNVSAASGTFGGITVRDEGSIVGTANSITTLNFVGENVNVVAASGPNGIATVTISSSVSEYANNAGVSTFATKAGIATYTSEWILGADETNNYTFTGPGLTGAENDPTLYLIRGQQYKFTNTMGAHPFRIQSTVNGSTGNIYNDGITNNDVSNGTLTWNVQFDAPSILYYQCTAHGSMGGKIYIIDAGIGTDVSINTTGIITALSFNGSLTGNATSATYATNAGIATYATSSGISTYATNAGIATYATNAGIATTATNLADAANIITGTISDARLPDLITSNINITSGVSTFATVEATTFQGTLTGNSSTATALQNSRTFEITGDIVASPISFNGTGNVSLAATIQPNSVALGTDTTGDYVQSITGTTNQITVTSGTGEGSSPTLSVPNQFTAPQDVTVTRDLQVNRNLNVNGNITIGGTSATLFTTEFKVYDPDIVLGFRTDGSGNDISTDNTANHGGIAIASTEGTPLVSLYDVGIGETNPATYKKFMWFKSGTFSGLGTDAWISNYAIGIGSTQVPNGVRLAAGGMQVTDSTVISPQLNISGVTTSLSFVKSGGTSSQFLKADGSVDSSTYLTTTDSGANLTGIVTSIVAGNNITISGSTGQVTINSSGTIIQDEGSNIGTAATTLNFVGSGVTASYSSGIATITVNPTPASKTSSRFVATSGQTTFAVSYTVGFVDVYLNGSKLDSTEFTATDGSQVVLTTGANLDEVIEVVSYNNVGLTTIFTSPDFRIFSTAEKLIRVDGNSVNIVYGNSSSGNVGLCTNPTGDITVNVTGIPTDSTFDNSVITFSIFVTQTGTARTCTAVNLNGVSRTIKWSGGSLNAALSGVTTSNGYDIFNFTGINTVGSASTTENYQVLGIVNGDFR